MSEPQPSRSSTLADGPWRGRLLLHPLTVVAIILLGVNDAVLKQAAPGLVTGKLSDIAGVWMIGAVVIALTAQPAVGALLTGLAFGALKTLPIVAGWAAPVLGGKTLTDRTDLIALAALPPLAIVATRVRTAAAPRSRTSLLHWAGTLSVLTAVTFTTTATSCDVRAEVSQLELADDGRVMVKTVYNSEAGWYSVDLDSEPVRVDQLSWTQAADAEPCIESRCYSVRPDEGFYDDSGVSIVSGDDITHSKGDCIQESFFKALVVRPTADGAEVWVSMGMDGLVVLATDGTLRQVTLPGLSTKRIDGVKRPGK